MGIPVHIYLGAGKIRSISMGEHLNWSILKRFSRKNIIVFGFIDVVREFPGKSSSAITRALVSMVCNGMICKIARDMYYVIPLCADPESYEPDGRLVAKSLMQNTAYYIGYDSALRMHALSSSESGKVYVVAEKQVNSAVGRIRGTSIQFINHHSDRIFGYCDRCINQKDLVKVSDLEKTIVDMASNPLYPGSIIALGRAIFQARNRTDYKLLIYYFARNGNRSAIKRYLYLVDLLDLEWNSGHEQMMEELGSSVPVLDPKGNRHGKYCGKFGLKVNMDPAFIKTEAFSGR